MSNARQYTRSASTLKAVYEIAELAELRSISSVVYLDAHGLEEAVEKLQHNGSNELIHKPLGNQSMKQG
jgi:hypothetical protein